ncbi:hypothetical protein PL373_05985 [Tenacibaculum maritimum]|nr:hypothetical protein [Tenacibaculum maritimum]MDB0600700.1 hypothetical protein [Tenacibaculum maritimum]MDB0612683.1 hypothetical protein [Tenacibaculum maritimum]
MVRIRKLDDRDALKKWESFSKGFDTPIEEDFNETFEQQRKRKERLLKNFEEFCYYYFPKVTKAKFAKWHKKFAKYLIEANHNINIAVAKISRDMAKSSVTALLIIFLYYNKEFKSLGMFSNNYDNAETLISPVKNALEKNERLKRDFGNRISLGNWTAGHFVTSDGVSFKALGAGQSPRGGKTDDADRYDFLVFDDFDLPDVCANPERLDKNWKYVEGDCFPAMHVSGKKRVVFLNNKIAEDCIVERMETKCKAEFPNALLFTVNLTDGEGNSNWPEAYTNQECKEMISLAGDEAQTEYFNDPQSKGKEFLKEWMVFKKLPPLRSYKYLIAYLDGGFKKTKTSDTKALVLIGFKDGEFHFRKVYVENVTIESMIAWHYDLHEYLKKKNSTAVWWMEEVFLLSLLHDHFDAAVETYSFRIPMKGDKRKKPDKDLRISNTAGYFERGKVFFDESLKDCRYTKRLIRQYINFKSGVRNNEKDGPDASEGAFYLLMDMAREALGNVTVGTSIKSKYKI